MGRPQRAHKERRETTISSNSSNSPLNTQSADPANLSLVSRASHAPSSSSSANGKIWLGQDFEDKTDSNSDLVQYQEFLDFALYSAAQDDDQMHTSASDDWFDDRIDHLFPQNLYDFGVDELATHEMRGAWQTSPLVSVQSTAISSMEIETQNVESNFLYLGQLNHAPIPQELVERISKLNLDLHQQSITAGRIATEYGNIEPSLKESSHKDDSLSCAIESMVQGLQTFHKLLLETFGSADQTTSIGSAENDTMGNHESNHPLVQTPLSQNTKLCARNLLGLVSPRHKDSARSTSPRNSLQRAASVGVSQKSHHSQDCPTQATLIDIPTSLMIISCYINLIQLCGHVFAAIRVATSPLGQQGTLLTISSLQIGGVSIDQDTALQIMILTQVVVRLVNKIRLLLGQPCNSPGEAGSERENAKCCGRAISPQLLQFVLRQEGLGGQPCSKRGIESLKAEITRLSEQVVCKTV